MAIMIVATSSHKGLTRAIFGPRVPTVREYNPQQLTEEKMAAQLPELISRFVPHWDLFVLLFGLSASVTAFNRLPALVSAVPGVSSHASQGHILMTMSPWGLQSGLVGLRLTWQKSSQRLAPPLHHTKDSLWPHLESLLVSWLTSLLQRKATLSSSPNQDCVNTWKKRLITFLLSEYRLRHQFPLIILQLFFQS